VKFINVPCFGAYDHRIRHAFVCHLREEPVPVVGSMAWTLNVASTHARQLVAVFQVLCSLYELTCVCYRQNSLQFISRSPLIHANGRGFCPYRDSLFAEIGDSNDKCSCWRFSVETKTKRMLHHSRRLRSNEFTNAKILCCIVAILLSTDAAARLCARWAL
jgi:hypothetical protein